MNDTYVLQMEGIEKEYSGVKVLRGIDLQVRPGEVVPLSAKTAQANQHS